VSLRRRRNVVLLVRGPRVIAAVLVGGALAVARPRRFQGLFRNPLVSPDILGASSGAALGAVLGIYCSLGVVGIEALAFAGGLLAVAAGLCDRHAACISRDPILVLVLTGVVIGSLLGAAVGPREIPRRSLQPASGHDLLAARQSRLRPPSRTCCRCSARSRPVRSCWWRCAGA